MVEPQTESKNALGTEVPASADAPGDAKPAPSIHDFDEDEEGSDSLLGEFMLFLREEKKWWLAPLVVLLLGISAVIIFAEGSAIAPFIYTIF